MHDVTGDYAITFSRRSVYELGLEWGVILQHNL